MTATALGDNEQIEMTAVRRDQPVDRVMEKRCTASA
jgi:hypothetical protein